MLKPQVSGFHNFVITEFINSLYTIEVTALVTRAQTRAQFIWSATISNANFSVAILT